MTMVGAAGDSRPGDIPTQSSCPPDDLRLLDDHELLGRLRAGDDDAFGELFARHGSAVRGYALRCAGDAGDAEDIAAEAFFRVLLAVRRGHGPADNARGYLLTVVRRVAAEYRVRRRDVPIPDEDLNRVPEPPIDRAANHAEACLIARAFATLPQRWRSVLWQMEVQGERPAVVAEEFGLSVNATAALARRARVGLRAAYLQAHLTSTNGASGCRIVVDKLGAYTAGTLRGRASRQVRGHLAGCDSCRALHAELADVCVGLRRYAGQWAPPILGAALPAHGAVAPGAAAHGVIAHHVATLAGKAAAVGARLKFAVAAASVTVVGGVGVVVVPLLIHGLPSDNADGVALDLLPPTVLSTPVSVPSSPTGPGGPTGFTGHAAPAGARLVPDRPVFIEPPQGPSITSAPSVSAGVVLADDGQPKSSGHPGPGKAGGSNGQSKDGGKDKNSGKSDGDQSPPGTTSYQVFAGPVSTPDSSTSAPTTSTTLSTTRSANGRIERSSRRHGVSPAGHSAAPVPWRHGR
ncbi:MAG TPA: sigma-70 family RNA polymerase sigma factor [Pseudonocardiaceae bacterium]|jgi:RNA polymerase sigma factor (sigma-70 family)|nr:sigma-70 family RNA polymerase sigma factor [Pseudonocardiaceae bacterium]